MATRTHVGVVVLLTSSLTTGCIFGGGEKKPQAKAAHARSSPSEPRSASPSGGPAAVDAVARSQSPQLQPQQQQALAAAQKRREAAAGAATSKPPALVPKDSAVEWPQDSAQQHRVREQDDRQAHEEHDELPRRDR